MQRTTVIGTVSLAVGLAGGFILREAVGSPSSWSVSRISVAGEEWLPIGRTGRSTVYFLPAAPTKVQMWVMYDYEDEQELKPVEKKYRSRKELTEFNCELRQLRAVHTALHQGSMGAGQLIASQTDEASKWVPIAPSSTGATLAKHACERQ